MNKLFMITVLTTIGISLNKTNFHTSPDKWDIPRLFQSKMNQEELLRNLSISKESIHSDSTNSKIFSPNKVYWYVLNKTESNSTTLSGSIHVFNERTYLIKLTFNYHENYEIAPKWINEKLLYFRIWQGRELATDLIFDVEKEMFIYSEFTHDGTIAFQQFKQGSHQ